MTMIRFITLGNTRKADEFIRKNIGKQEARRKHRTEQRDKSEKTNRLVTVTCGIRMINSELQTIFVKLFSRFIYAFAEDKIFSNDPFYNPMQNWSPVANSLKAVCLFQ